MEYQYDTINNTVTAIMRSNEELADTKPTWALSSDKMTYTKVFNENGSYSTVVTDIYGNTTNVVIKVTQIDDKGPEISLEYIHNQNGTITVIMHSNEELADTKPTWTLSQNKLEYTKIFNEDTEYSTAVYDIYGNETWVKITILTRSYTYTNAVGPNITVKYLYDSYDKVTVQIISDTPLKDTKSTWTLSQDKMIYKKVFTENEIYATVVEDINGNQVEISIIVNFFKDTFKGIDVSEYQKMINWSAVKSTGIDFAIIRVGYRGWGSSGTLVEDRYFSTNIQQATRVGMDIGFYFFTQATTVAEARQEAQYTLSLLSKYNVPVKYPIAIDTERTPVGTGRADGLSKQTRTDIVIAFCEEIKSAGYKPMIYANKNWLLNDLEVQRLTGYDVWLAHYTTSTDYQYPYTIWQYTSSGSVSGIVGNVDMNVAYKRY